MNAVRTASVTTQDTNEVIPAAVVLGDYHLNDGYDWMDLIGEHGWAAVPGWGSEGWDLGQWPYVIVAATAATDNTGKLYGVATYCEGDVTCTYYRTQARQWDAITEHAFFSWKHGQAHGPADLPEAAAELPSRDRQPYAPASAA
ncbi:UNVERIFIED_ORG: hypothetical protein ABIB19_003702 [Arthrobacter sp. UYEF10]